MVFPVDFYVLDMDDERSPNPAPILLGRPFMKTAGVVVNVKEDTMSLEFDGATVCFNPFEDARYIDSKSVNSVCIIDAFDDVQTISNGCKQDFGKAEFQFQGYFNNKTSVMVESAENKMDGWPTCGCGDPG